MNVAGVVPTSTVLEVTSLCGTPRLEGRCYGCDYPLKRSMPLISARDLSEVTMETLTSLGGMRRSGRGLLSIMTSKIVSRSRGPVLRSVLDGLSRLATMSRGLGI